MLHPVLAAFRPASSAANPGRVTRPAAWAPRPDAGPEIVVLVTACRDIAATVRGYRTVLPLAKVFLYGDDLSPEAVADGEAAGAIVRAVAPCGRNALVRRMLAEVDADIYLLSHGVGPDDACVAPLIVMEIDAGEKDLVDVSRFADAPPGDAGDRLLSRTVDFLFGRGGDMLASDVKACSRRFAISYRATASGGGPDVASALDLSLHALRLRLPIGSVASLGTTHASPSPARTAGGWAALLGLVGRLLVEERPRRVLGLVGLAVVAAGIAAALPVLEIHHGWATLPWCPATLLSLALMTAGATIGIAGAALDSLAAARQEVKRVGVRAIPRRAAPRAPQSSVS